MSLRMRTSLPAFAGLLALLLLPVPAGAEGVAFRVKDINTDDAQATGWICTWLARYERRGGAVAAVPGTLLFLASAAGTGCELWATSGDPDGTRLVRELVLGGTPGVDFMLGVAGEVAFLDAWTPEAGRQVWRSDGSAAGTYRLTDADVDSSWTGVGPFHALGTLGLFFLRDRSRGVELWSSDGTVAGTSRVTLLSPARSSDEYDPWYEGAVVTGGRLYFTTDDGRRLWRTDGTSGGTAVVHDFGGSYPADAHDLAVLGDRIYGAWRDVLWASDGTAAGTSIIASFPGWIDHLAATEERLFLIVEGSLWSFGTGADPGRLLADFDYADRPVPLGGRVVLFADDGARGFEPWASDGTPEGTVPLGDFAPGPDPGCQDDCAMVVAGDLAYFNAGTSSQQTSLWVTDGTPGGTRDLAPLIRGADPASLQALGATAKGMVLSATTLEDSEELYLVDEGAGRATRITSLGGQVTATSVRRLTDLDGTLVFVARKGPGWGPEDGPWRSDGTAAGTLPIEPVGPPRDFDDRVVLPSGLLVARSTCDDCGDLLWATDGVTRWEIGWFWYHCQHHVCGIPSNLWPIGDALFFAWQSKSTGWELWSSDGTPEGTGLALDLRPGPEPSSPFRFAGFFDASLFFANDGQHGFEPWVTSGSPESTYLLDDLEPGPESGWPPGLWPFDASDGSFFFVREAGVPYPERDHLELWFHPLSSPLVLRPLDVRPVRVGPDFDDARFDAMGVVGGRFLFVAAVADPERQNEDFELWASDGTDEGTALVRDIFPGPGSSLASRAVSLGDRIVFVACDPESGCEPWVSDGTAVGTRSLGDLAPGWPSSAPSGLSAIGGQVVFAACDEASGCEPWATDGTPAGTRRLDEIAAGRASALGAQPPGLRWSEGEGEPSFVRSGDLVYFAADDGTGTELWAMPADAVIGDGFARGDAGRGSAP